MVVNGSISHTKGARTYSTKGTMLKIVHGENRSRKPSFGSMGLCVLSACIQKMNDIVRAKIASGYLSTYDRNIWVILNAWP